jgi:16S rRNA (cytosine967-C5)-methyltransferase
VAARVAPGGVLVYSVCSFTRLEGEEQVAGFRARHPEFRVAPPPEGEVAWPALTGPDGYVRTFPHRHRADAFFAARLVRG